VKEGSSILILNIFSFHVELNRGFLMTGVLCVDSGHPGFQVTGTHVRNSQKKLV